MKAFNPDDLPPLATSPEMLEGQLNARFGDIETPPETSDYEDDIEIDNPADEQPDIEFILPNNDDVQMIEMALSAFVSPLMEVIGMEALTNDEINRLSMTGAGVMAHHPNLFGGAVNPKTAAWGVFATTCWMCFFPRIKAMRAARNEGVIAPKASDIVQEGRQFDQN